MTSFDFREVVVCVYVSADNEDEASNIAEEELTYLCSLDNALVGFTLEGDKDNG
jgi:hypothetical protein